MKEKINQKGFIKVSLLIAFIIGILFISGGSYFGYVQFKNYQVKKAEKEKQAQELFEAQQKSLEEAKKEIENLKDQQSTQAEQLNLKENINTDLANAEIIAKIKPAVVYVETIYGAGSGMIIGKDGYILTNAHVTKGAMSIKIYLSSGESFPVEKIATNEDADIALLRINTNNLPVVELNDSNKANPGDEVFTFGYPFGIKGDVSFKEGTISRRLTTNNTTYLETSAEIHPGNSGGPLVNRQGKVIGINTGKIGESINGVLLGESIKFAIPINIASNLIPTLKLSEKSVTTLTSDCSLQKAKGFITIYSNLPSPQKIVPSSRFLSAQGLIFRIDENILVPANGNITVSVTADNFGSEYKIGPSTFSMPGFVGTEKYTKIYGQSYQSMSCD